MTEFVVLFFTDANTFFGAVVYLSVIIPTGIFILRLSKAFDE